MDAQGLELGDVDLLDIGEMRDAALGLLHLLGDPAAQADDLDVFDALAARPSGPAGRRPGHAPPPATKASRSSWLIRPAGPVPGTNCRPTPSSCARRRTAGEASGLFAGDARAAGGRGLLPARGWGRHAVRAGGLGLGAGGDARQQSPCPLSTGPAG